MKDGSRFGGHIFKWIGKESRLTQSTRFRGGVDWRQHVTTSCASQKRFMLTVQCTTQCSTKLINFVEKTAASQAS